MLLSVRGQGKLLAILASGRSGGEIADHVRRLRVDSALGASVTWVWNFVWILLGRNPGSPIRISLGMRRGISIWLYGGRTGGIWGGERTVVGTAVACTEASALAAAKLDALGRYNADAKFARHELSVIQRRYDTDTAGGRDIVQQGAWDDFFSGL